MKKNNGKEAYLHSNFGCKFKPAKNKLVLETKMQYDEKEG